MKAQGGRQAHRRHCCQTDECYYT